MTDLLVHLSLVAQLSLGLVILISAIPKVRDFDGFVDVVRDYRILPGSLASLVAFGLVGGESALAVALLTGLGLDIALPAALAMLAGFAIAVGINLWRGRAIDCGCFGAHGQRISMRSEFRIVLLLATAIGVVSLRAIASIRPAMTVDLALTDPTYVAVATIEGGFLLAVGAWILSSPEAASVVRILWLRNGSRRS